jgi:hypothetical protein
MKWRTSIRLCREINIRNNKSYNKLMSKCIANPSKSRHLLWEDIIIQSISFKITICHHLQARKLYTIWIWQWSCRNRIIKRTSFCCWEMRRSINYRNRWKSLMINWLKQSIRLKLRKLSWQIRKESIRKWRGSILVRKINMSS